VRRDLAIKIALLLRCLFGSADTSDLMERGGAVIEVVLMELTDIQFDIPGQCVTSQLILFSPSKATTKTCDFVVVVAGGCHDRQH
jgi:hypothetical protein